MSTFTMNGYSWQVFRVSHDDPMLVDRTNTRTVATTDPETYHVYLSEDLQGDFLVHVLIHELGHCALFSFHLIEDIHRVVYPEYWIEAEEWVCNFIADFGSLIFRSAYQTLGMKALDQIPVKMEEWIRREGLDDIHRAIYR